MAWLYLMVVGLLVGNVVPTLFYYAVLLAPKPVAFVVRVVASYVALMVSALIGVFASVFLHAFGDVLLAQWATGRCFKHMMWRFTGVTFAVDDPHKVLVTTRPAVLIGNHQTELDVLMLGCVFPKACTVTAKSSLRLVPFLGWYMSLSGTVFIDRKNSRDAREAMRGAGDEMRRKRKSVFMFPEGTRSYAKDPTLLPFKKGAFHLAIQAQVPIVPVVVANYSHMLSVKGLVFNPGEIPVKVLDPIPTTGLTAADVDQLTTRTREAMLEEMVSLTAKARGSPIVMSAQEQNGVAKASGVHVRNLARDG